MHIVKEKLAVTLKKKKKKIKIWDLKRKMIKLISSLNEMYSLYKII